MEVPYTLWDHQRILLDRWVRFGPKAGHLNLKAASLGSSSLALAFGMVEIMSQPDKTLVLLAHEEGLAQTLLRRAKRFVEVAQESKTGYIDFPGYNRNRNDYIELENRSYAYIETAGSNNDPGRGNPINIFIGTEVAFWKNMGLFTALIPRLPGIKIFESTGNGASGWFYKQCCQCAIGKGTYHFTFVPWFVHHEYCVDGDVKLDDKTDDEFDLQNTFGITDGQLKWRREKIEEMDSGESVNGEDAFKQEYPTTWEEAFLRSGSPIFGYKVYNKIEQTIKDPIFQGDILGI